MARNEDSKNLDWSAIAFRLGVLSLTQEGGITLDDVLAEIGDTPRAGCKTQMQKWRRKFALEVEHGRHANLGGSSGPTLKKKALTPRERKTSAICRDSMRVAHELLCGGVSEDDEPQGRGRKTKPLDLGELVDNVVFDDEILQEGDDTPLQD